LVELQKYGEALGPLDEAIKVSTDKPDVAYPTIAINAKVEALSGLGRNQEALALASERCNERPITTWLDISTSSIKPEPASMVEWANGIELRTTTPARSNLQNSCPIGEA
jgi:hypothetical protein